MNLRYFPFTCPFKREACLLEYKKKAYSLFVSDLNRGNISLKEEINNYLNKKPSSSFDQAIKWALWDFNQQISEEKRFKQIPIRSHFFLSSLNDYNSLLEEKIVSSGFKSIKCKLGKSFDYEKLKEIFQKTSLKWRLDFNCSLSEKDLRDFCEFFKNHLSCIDFLEDPILFNEDLWGKIKKEFKVSLALDQKPDTKKILKSFDVLVLKPIREDIFSYIKLYENEKVNFVLTHFMDHPLGQLITYKASEIVLESYPKTRLLDCGLLSPILSKAFFPLKQNKAYLEVKNSIGWGLDLSHLDWKEI